MAQEPETTTKRAELPMRLTRLRVKNFRSIADIDIPLSPLTVLVGPNGSGKSNVVDALRFVRDVFARGLDQAVMDREGMGVIQRWGTEGEEIHFEIDISSGAVSSEGDFISLGFRMPGKAATIITYSFSITETDNNELLIKKEEILVLSHKANVPTVQIVRIGNMLKGKFGDGNWIERLERSSLGLLSNARAQLWLPGPYSSLFFLFENKEGIRYDNEEYGLHTHIETDKDDAIIFLRSALFYTLNSTDLRQPQRTLEETPFDENGRNLAAVLRRLTKSGGADWSNLRLALHQAVAGFDTYGVEAIGGYLVTKLMYQNDDRQFRASYIGQESDGTIRMLGLLAALYQEPSQPFVCIEEPEANIHPGALAVLAGVIDEASLRSQILVTTHSPDMLDHLPVESFLVVEKVGDTTHVGPLDASQIASVRKRLFTPGELFRMEGLQRQAESAS